ncbi:MAG: FG-GAP repeat domain-containing protein [Terriglobales bacterium]
MNVLEGRNRMSRTFPAFVLIALLMVSSVAAQQPMFAPAPGSPFTVAGSPGGLLLDDLDGNQTLDVVAASSSGLTVMLGDGRGNFRQAPGSPVVAGPSPHLVAAGDLNGDRKADLAATSHNSNDVYVLLGAGDGSFRPAPGSPLLAFANVKPHNHGLALADVNADGRLDITSGHQDAGRIAVLLNDGRGGFAAAPGSPVSVGRTPYPHLLADLNKDGKLDLIVPDVVGNALTVMLGNGRGGFSPAPGSPIRTLQRPFFVLLDEFNADGNLDLAASHDDISDITILLGDGKGGFQAAPGPQLNAGRRGWKMASGDWNHDGHRDLALAGSGVTLFLGDGKGKFSAAPEFNTLRPHTSGWIVAVGDVNRDGKLDLIAPGTREGSIAALLGR